MLRGANASAVACALVRRRCIVRRVRCARARRRTLQRGGFGRRALAPRTPHPCRDDSDEHQRRHECELRLHEPNLQRTTNESQRHGDAEPAVAPRVPLVELHAQLGQSTLQARLHRGDARALARGDLARRAFVEVAQQQRVAVGLLEREHGVDELALQPRARHQLVRVRDRLRPCGRAFAGLAARLTAPPQLRDAAHHAREPSTQILRRGQRTLQRGAPGLLHQLVGLVRVACERLGDPPHPSGVGHQLGRVETCALHRPPGCRAGSNGCAAPSCGSLPCALDCRKARAAMGLRAGAPAWTSFAATPSRAQRALLDKRPAPP